MIVSLVTDAPASRNPLPFPKVMKGKSTQWGEALVFFMEAGRGTVLRAGGEMGWRVGSYQSGWEMGWFEDLPPNASVVIRN